MFVILQMYHHDVLLPLEKYTSTVLLATGIQVSTSPISQFFNKGFVFKGSMCTPNLVPYDKFCPANFAKAMEYMLFVSTFKPERIKFGDEKHIEDAD
jgi:hypothetical protein